MALRRLASTTLKRDARGAIALLSDMPLYDAASPTQLPIRDGAMKITQRGKRSYKKKLVDCFQTEIEHENDNYETDTIVKDGPPNGFDLLEMEGDKIVLHKKIENEDISVKASFVEQPLPEKENPEDPESAKPSLPKRVVLSNRRRPLFDHPPLGKKHERSYTIVRDPFKANVKFVLPKTLVIGPEGKFHHTLGWTIDQDPPKDPFFDPPLLEVSQTVVLSIKISKEGQDKQLSIDCETDGGYMSINHAGIEDVNSATGESDYTGPAFGELDETLQDTYNNWLEERGIDDTLGDYLVQKIHDLEQQHYQQWLENTRAFIAAE